MPRTSCAALLLLAACATDLPHRWTHPAFQWTTHSDFAPLLTDMMFDGERGRQIRALCRLFEVDSLRDLHVYVHDQHGAVLGADARVAGWHQDGEIHLYASWAGSGIGIPGFGSDQRFRHELVHALHRAAGLAPPRWLEEGPCEVLSASVVDAAGTLVLLPHADREREVRQLRAAGRWLPAEQLLAQREGYPDDPAQLPPMYAEATAFTWFLLADTTSPSRADLVALAQLPDDALRTRFAQFEQQLAATTVTHLFAPFVRHRGAQVREAAAAGIELAAGDDGWQLAAALLGDEASAVRRTARIRFAYLPNADEATRAGLQRWAESTDRNVRLAGVCALAQYGDLAAAQSFLRALHGSDDAEWCQAVLWIALIVPSDGPEARALPNEIRAYSEPDCLQEYCSMLAADLERMAPRLRWDDAARRWRLQ